MPMQKKSRFGGVGFKSLVEVNPAFPTMPIGEKADFSFDVAVGDLECENYGALYNCTYEATMIISSTKSTDEPVEQIETLTTSFTEIDGNWQITSR